jgi:uncharacterized protein YqgC (DUF456 family)
MGAVLVTAVALFLAVALFILGLVGTLLPLLPGPVFIYAGMLLYGVLTGFATLDTNFFLLQGMALLFLFTLDFIATAAGSRHFGGSKQAALGAVVGTLIGVFIFGPFGIILGPFLGAVTVEFIRGKRANQAVTAGFGTIIGLLGGTVIKLSIEILMIIYFFLNI